MRTVNLVEFTDLLSHAETLGYGWNDAIEILDGIPPEYEVKQRNWSLIEFLPPDNPETVQDVCGFYNDARDHSDDCNRIMATYFGKHGVKQITVIND